MDENKLKVLRDIGYEIRPCCGLCVHGTFRGIKDDFGSCAARTYDHKKHTGDARQLSIHRAGLCNEKFELDEAKQGMLGAWAEFVKE